MQNYSTTSLAGANAAVPKAPNLQSLIEDFDPAIGRLESLVSRAANCGDRIAGSRPQAVGDAKEASNPNHLLFAVQLRRERLVRAIDFLESEIGRIESGLS